MRAEQDEKISVLTDKINVLVEQAEKAGCEVELFWIWYSSSWLKVAGIEHFEKTKIYSMLAAKQLKIHMAVKQSLYELFSTDCEL